MRGDNKERGSRGEQLAAEYLVKKGMMIVVRNYRYERAEVDLICRDGNELVFVEVKSRRSTLYGEPEESVTLFKEEQLRKAASGYCQEFLLDDQFYRFDIVAIIEQEGRLTIRHIKDAF